MNVNFNDAEAVVLVQIGDLDEMAVLEFPWAPPLPVELYKTAAVELPGARKRSLEGLLFVLTRPLPKAERTRTYLEWCGSLQHCEGWWERITFVADLAIATPRLALVMRRYPRISRGK